MSRSGPSRLRRALLGYRCSDVHALLADEARAMDELSALNEELEARIVAREQALAETRREADEARDAARRAADALRLIGAHLEDLHAAARAEAERIRDQARAELRAARDRVRELESVEAGLIRATEEHREIGAELGEGEREVARLDSITDELSRLSERLGGASDELDEAAELVLRHAPEQDEEEEGEAATGEEASAAPGTDVAGRIRRLEERAEAIQALATGSAPRSGGTPRAPSSPDGVRTLRVDVGPVEDFETLTCFMDSLDGLEGVERVTIKRFSDRRAVLVVEVGSSIDLRAELTQLGSVRIVERGERESGSMIVDLADRDAGKAA